MTEYSAPEYYEMDYNGDGRQDAVEVYERDSGGALALVDVNGDDYADYAVDLAENGDVVGTLNIGTGEYHFGPQLQASANMAREWADLPPLEEDDVVDRESERKY